MILTGRGGIDGIRRHIQVVFTALSNAEHRLEDMILEGSTVVARWTLAGTHTCDFLGMPPTHARIETSDIDLYRLEGSKISEHWHEIDMLKLMAELKAK